MSDSDRRVHVRVQVETKVRVSAPNGVFEGQVRDLSKGGAGIYLDEVVGKQGDSIELFLPIEEGDDIVVMAEILRVVYTSRGILHGTRFQMVEPSMREKLLELIEKLVKEAGGGKRKHARLSQRLPIEVDNLKDFKANIENISMGGLAMVVEEPLVLDQEVELSIPDLEGNELLVVKGRVIHQTQLSEEYAQGCRVGLEFEELSAEDRTLLAKLLVDILQKQDDEKS